MGSPSYVERGALAGGVVLAGIGGLGLIGWLAGVPRLAAPWPGGSALCLAGAVALLLMGTSLALYAWPQSRPRTLAAAVLAFAVAVILIDVLSQRTGYPLFGLDDAVRESLWPGRAPFGPAERSATPLVLLFAAVSLIGLAWFRGAVWSAWMYLVSGLIVAFVLITAVADGFGVGYLYHAALFTPLPAQLYAALPLLAWALWQLARPREAQPASHRTADDRILQAAGAALAVTVVLVTVVGLIDVKKAIEGNKGEMLLARARGDADRIEWELRHADRDAAIVASRPLVIQSLKVLQDASAEPEARRASLAALEEGARAFLDGWFSALTLQDASGRTVLMSGQLRERAALRVRLPGGDRSLLWDDEFIMRIRHPIRGPEGLLGYVETEQVLVESSAAQVDLRDMGETGEVLLCARQANDKLCFPSRFKRMGTRGPVSPQPVMDVDRGLAGQGGVFGVSDEGGRRLLSAVQPLPDEGLALVVRLDRAEVLSRLRQQIEWGLPLMVLLALGGVLALRARVRPLASALVAAKDEAEAISMRWAALNESAIDGFMLLKAVRGPDGKLLDFNVVEMNPAARRMTGARVEAPLLSQAFDLEAGSELARHCAEVLETRLAKTCEVEVDSPRLQAAGWCWLQHNIVPFGDGLALTSRDLTARKAAELQLVEAQERLQLVTDNVPILLGYVDDQERYRFANRSCTEVIGRHGDPVVGRTVREVLGEEAYGVIRPFIAAALQGRTVRFGRWHRSSGDERYLDAMYVPDVDSQGRVRGYFAAVADQTALRRAEEESRALADRLQTITDTLPVLIAFIDADHVFRFNNRAYVEWYAKPLSTITGRPIVELIGEEAYALSKATMDHAARIRQPVTMEREAKRGGKHLYLEVLYAPQYAEDGRLLGFSVVTKDITQSKRYELQLLNEARRDPLTDLANRLAFEDRLNAALDRPRRPGSFAVAYLDVDHFKRVNDEYGHAAGDFLLKTLAKRCIGALRRSDTPARLGGDEFALILEELAQPGDIEAIARKLFNAWSLPLEHEGQTLVMSCSVGIAAYEAGDTAKSILERADRALYEAKRRGRNTYVIAESAATTAFPAAEDPPAG